MLCLAPKPSPTEEVIRDASTKADGPLDKPLTKMFTLSSSYINTQGQKLMAVSEAKVMEIAARRQRVMQLRVRGFTRKTIAEQVGVSLSTVKSDLAELMDGMKRNAAEDMGRWRKMSEARYRYVVNEMSKRMESDEDTKSAAAAGKVLVNAQTRMDKVRGVDAPQLIDTNLNLDTGHAGATTRNSDGTTGSRREGMA